MNAIKKLREMGFRKTQFHRPGYDSITYESLMVLDVFETKTEWVNGRSTTIKIEKKHPKSNSFWIFKYNDNYILWCLVVNHKIGKIWLENKSVASLGPNLWKKYGEDDRLKLIFDYSHYQSSPISGKNQIINLFPKEMRRDYLLEQLFGI